MTHQSDLHQEIHAVALARPPRAKSWKTQWRRLPSWLQWVLIGFLFLTLSVAVNARFIMEHTAVSPIDEYVYIDAVDKATHGIVVREGMETGELARQAYACRGVGFEDSSTSYVGTCGIDNPASTYPWGGHTSAHIHSPVYFFLTAWMAEVIQQVTPAQNLITAARLVSSIWMATGMVALAYLIRRIDRGWVQAIALPVLATSMPLFRQTNSYITPDSMNLLWGSLIFLSGILYARKEWTLWPLLLISAVATLVKLQNSFAVIALVIFLLWYKISPGPNRDVSYRWSSLILIPLSAISAGAGWMMLHSLIRVTATNDSVDPSAGVSIISNIFALDDTLQGIMGGNLSLSTPNSFFPNLVLWAGVGALIGSAFYYRDNSWFDRRFAQAGIISLLGVGPAVTLSFAIFFGSEVGMQPRYGQVLLPILVIAAAQSIDRRSVKWGLMIFSLAAYLYAALFAAAN